MLTHEFQFMPIHDRFSGGTSWVIRTAADPIEIWIDDFMIKEGYPRP